MAEVMTKEQYIDKILRDYVDRFHASVPLFELPSMTDDELIELVSEALKTGQPIVPDTPDDPTILY